jgi:predicted MFS family arabinose efflux permease
MPDLRADLALDMATGGWVASIFNLTSLTLALVLGAFADRIGRWRACQAGLALLALGSTLGAFCETSGSLMLSRLLEGFGFTIVVVSAPSIIAQATAPSDRRGALSIWSCYMPSAIALAMVIAPAVIGDFGWRGLWLALSSATLICLALMIRVQERPPESRASGGSFGANLARTARLPGPWLLAACFAFYAFQWVSLMIWLPSFLIEEFALGSAAAALLSALVVAMNVPGNLLGGWLLQRGAARWRLIVAASLAMGLAELGIFADALPVALRYGLCLAFSGFGGLLPTAVLSGAPVFAPTPAQIGTVNGILVQGSNLGHLLGPPALGAVVQASGDWQATAWLMLAAATITALLALLVRRVERQRPLS